jgi:hypothetical protein
MNNITKAKLVITLGIIMSATAAYFSINGLVQIFINNVIPIIIMGGCLEIAKLMKSYFLIAITGIMMITSLGVYGFLSNSSANINNDIQQSSINQEYNNKQIQYHQSIVQSAIKQRNQLDDTIDTLIKYDRIRGPQGAINTRNNQKIERNYIMNTINNANKDIYTINNIIHNEQSKNQDNLNEVGPIISIAKLFNINDYNNSLNILIILIIFVFDPLALLLTLSGTIILKKEYDNIHNIHNNTNDNDEMTQDNIIHNIIDNNIHNIHDNIDNNVIDKIGLGGGEYSYADVPSDTLSRIKKERINDLTKKHDI